MQHSQQSVKSNKDKTLIDIVKEYIKKSKRQTDTQATMVDAAEKHTVSNRACSFMRFHLTIPFDSNSVASFRIRTC